MITQFIKFVQSLRSLTSTANDTEYSPTPLSFLLLKNILDENHNIKENLHSISLPVTALKFMIY